ncbi:MAG: acetolactate synthase small subunit [Candidatus Margulisiibacteriota bacterium]|jgi:acetolactate synthase-1/3 small subunit
MTTTFSVLVENKFWVLAKISRLFSRHMFNIQSLTVAPTINEKISAMTIDVEENEARIRRMELELEKLTNVISVHICNEQDFVETEMVLIKINKNELDHKKMITALEKFDIRIIYQHIEIEIFEFSGDKKQINQFLEIVQKFKVLEIVRTGSLALTKAKEF